MAETNVSEAGKYEKYDQLYCSAESSNAIRKELLSLSVINIFLCIPVLLGNILIQVAFLKECSLHPPTKLLLRTLSVTDLCVGVISEPLIVTGWLSAVFGNREVCRHALSLVFLPVYIIGPVSLMILTTISIDRLLALVLGIKYRQVVTLNRTRGIVIVIWGISLMTASMYFWNYHHVTLWCGNIGITLCLAISICCYSKIFFNLHHHQIQVKDLAGRRETSIPSQLNMARYRKAVSSAVWLQIALVFCYLPYGIIGTLWTICEPSPSLYLAKEFSLTLVFLNSSLNPVLYCWKIREVRQAVKGTLRHFARSSS